MLAEVRASQRTNGRKLRRVKKYCSGASIYAHIGPRDAVDSSSLSGQLIKTRRIASGEDIDFRTAMMIARGEEIAGASEVRLRN
jgi:hypothetical protein